ncbi:MAG: hypothetical protein LBI42_07490, partial [Chitinispirillales bacterium]|nr:hypothetical protein [Chitinispirillales bacterium]
MVLIEAKNITLLQTVSRGKFNRYFTCLYVAKRILLIIAQFRRFDRIDLIYHKKGLLCQENISTLKMISLSNGYLVN